MAEPTLKSLCLGCAKYHGDDLGKLLATVCLSPYFVIFSAALIVWSRRELHMLFVLVGLLLNAGLGFAIKSLLRHPRPAATCHLLGICHKHGMPSSHMQVMAFAVTTCTLLWWQRQRGEKAGTAVAVHPVSWLVQQAELVLFAGLAAAVGYARVHLGYHTPAQVVVGAVVGCAFATAWHLLVIHVARPHFGRLSAFSASMGLWFRDTLDISDVHRAEYDACGGPVATKHKPA